MIVEIALKKKIVDDVIEHGPKPAEYRVAGKRYLRIKVRKHRISLAVSMCHEGVRKSEVLGEYPYLSLSKFEQLGTEAYSQFINSAYPRLSDVTFGEVFEHLFTRAREREGRKSLPKYKQLYRDYVEAALGSKRLKNISSLDIENALRLVSERCSDAMFNHVRVLIVGVFKIAIAHNLTSFDPTKAVPPRRLDNVVDRYLTDPEVAAFTDACRGFGPSLPHLCLLLALLTGARIGNIISLRKGDLDFDRSRLTLRKTKSGRPQVLPMSGQVADVLREILAISDSASPFIFSSSRSRTGHISHPRKAFMQVCRRARIATAGSGYTVAADFPTSPVTIHSLRKTFATAVLTQTGDIYCASQLLGHASVEVTRRYAFVPKSRLAEAAQAASSRLCGENGAESPT
ncbi:site-specific integrase [Proteobacteria bacterium 005FR1]|nr:site-specific integrase [Proteobacteria bacterium 005FR1]